MTTETQLAIRAGILGGSGSTGAELAGLLARHRFVSLDFATSREHAGGTIRDVDPAGPDVPLVDPETIDPGAVDVVFTCLPHGRSAQSVKRCVDAGARVVDLSGDFRLRDGVTHVQTYGSARDDAIAASVVYGLTELARADLPGATVVANPGCYPTCTGLALAPAVAAGAVRGPVVVNALSGVSGAGRRATPSTHFCAVSNDVRPYKLGREHRHVPEIEQIMDDVASDAAPPAQVVFCPHVIPIERGMLATCVIDDLGIELAELHDAYVEAFGDEPFIDVRPLGSEARIRGVVGTNRAMIGVHAVDGRNAAVITCAIDNLLKGAAGQAVQNMNVMFGVEETEGLGLTFASANITSAMMEACG